jgi:hypothetical protein
VVVRPFLDLVSVAIGPPIRIVAVPIALVQPLLVLTLELVIEDHPIDACATLPEAAGLPEVRAKYLGVVFRLARLFQIRVELLTMILPAVLAVIARMIAAIRFQQVSTLFRQDNRHVPMTGQPLGSDEPLIAEVSEVAGPRIGRTLVIVAKVACRDDAKRANSRQRARFRAPQGVLVLPGIADDRSVRSARQVEVAHEYIAGIESLTTIARIALAFQPA